MSATPLRSSPPTASNAPTRRPSAPCARTTARARRSTVNSTTPTAVRRRSPVRCECFGAARAPLPIFYADPLELWLALAPQATGRAVEYASHFLVEDAPDEVVRQLGEFFG